MAHGNVNGGMQQNKSVQTMHNAKDNGPVQDMDIKFNFPSNQVSESSSSPCLTPTSSSQKTTTIPVAICGMSMRLPGDVSSDAEFWRLLIEKKDARSRVPFDRYNIDGFQSNVNKAGTIQGETGYYLNHVDLTHFDASFFSMTSSELEKLDPQHRLLLEIVRECLENAGVTKWRGLRTGCYIGSFGEDWLGIQTRDTQGSNKNRITGYGDYMLANRISYEYDFRGPSVTIKTACSSSTACLDMAFKALQTGEIESAIVGGSNLIMSPALTQSLTEQGVLSPDGSCRTFDAAANGYARGEAVSALYIKRLENAVRDGNPVRAIIRSTASNFDGKTAGITLPSIASQEMLIRACYEAAGLSDQFGETAFVECHGTGTPAGDPIETTAVANVFGEKGVFIGSVKPNVGHSEGAAGLSSIIKIVLALENRTIPPNIKFDTPNPRIPFQKGRLQVPINPISWPVDRHERASVNSFGIGGANSHVILDSAASFGLGIRNCHPVPNAFAKSWPEPPPGTMSSASEMPTSRLMVCTANHVESLQQAAKNLERYIGGSSDFDADATMSGKRPAEIEDVAYTLGARREHLPYRTFTVADGLSTPVFSAPAKSPKLAPDIVFVFTGQGAQWATMGTSILSDFPSALRDAELMDEALAELPEPPTWTIAGELHKPDSTSRMHKAEFSQPLSTALQIILVNLLQSWDFSPVAVVGHSSGEIAAAYAAGALSMQEAIIVAYLRGLAFTKQQTRPGTMAAVGLGRDAVRPYLVDGVVIACENSPMSITLSGGITEVDSVVERIRGDFPGVFARRLQVEMAYHSPHMRETGEEFERMVGSRVSSKAPSVPFFSSQTGQAIQHAHALDAPYWRSSYDSPVLFHTALEALLAARSSPSSLENAPSQSLLLEIGPHSALAGPIRQILKAVQSDALYVPTLVRKENETRSLLTAVGNLFLKGLKPNFAALNPRGRVLSDLPSYPWRHVARYWSESRVSRQWRLRSFPRHDLLGSQVHECGDLHPVWRNMLSLDDVPWCRDHVISGDIVFPGAGYIAMAAEAVRQISCAASPNSRNDGILGVGQTQEFTLRDLSLSAALTLRESVATEILLTMRPLRLTNSLDSAWHEFTVMSYSDTGNGATTGTWTKHCAGQVRAGADHAAEIQGPRAPIVDLVRKVQSPAWYRLMRKVGMEYGPCFHRLEDASAHPTRCSAVAHVCDIFDEADSAYQLHPATIDACIQLLTVAACRGQPRRFGDSPLVPTHIGKVYLRRPSTIETSIAVHADAEFGSKGNIDGSCHGVAAGEDLVLRLEDVKLAPLGTGGFDSDKDPHAAVVLQWKPDIEFQAGLLIHGAMGSERGEEDLHDVLRSLVLLCSTEAADRLSALGDHSERMAKLMAWLRAQANTADSNMEGLVGLPSTERVKLIAKITTQLSETKVSAVGTAMCRILGAIEDIFRTETRAMHLLQQDGLLEDVYALRGNLTFQEHWPFFQLLSHSNPNLRILQIGTGGFVGAATRMMLDSLISEFGERMFHRFTVTDTSTDALDAAKEKLKDIQGVEVLPLDIRFDPAEQGFESASFDLVICANEVIDTTSGPGSTFAHLRQLLQVHGKLLVQNEYSGAAWFDFILGIAHSWWLKGSEGSALQEMKRSLLAADFLVLYQASAAIIVSPSPPVHKDTTAGRLFLLSALPDGHIARSMSTALEGRGYFVDIVEFGSHLHPAQDTISILDLERERPFLTDITAQDYASLKRLVTGVQEHASGLLWITKACQIRCAEPRYAEILGLARTLRSELSVDFATLELDVDTNPSTSGMSVETMDAICNVWQKFQRRENAKDEAVDVDYEYALVENVVHLPRFHWVSVMDGLAIDPAGCGGQAAIIPTVTPTRLEIGKRGSLKSLQWTAQPPHANLTGNEVLVEIRAVGMNFKDILIAMGALECQTADGNGLGCECSGTIKATGPDVDLEHLQIGDRVCVGASNTYTTLLRTTSNHCAKMPAELSFEDAATMPCVYGTVIHGLLDLARCEAGQTVLVHSACGGIGIAAIHICRMIGARVFATVSSQEKVDYLMDTFNIPRAHIFGSRDAEFLPAVMRETKGRGVDVALNSLSGDLLHATWSCVAEFGSMVEIGKRDFIGQGRLAMDPFEANRSYFGVDLAHMYTQRPGKIRSILERIMSFYQQGGIQPVRPTTYFEAAQVQDAFHSMQKGRHIGKFVIRMPASPWLTPTAKARGSLSLRPDVSYLLVGGLGGLGRSVAMWLVEQGARNLIFLSRSSGKSRPETAALLQELAAADCHVQMVAGNVACLSDVKKTIAQAQLPIAGILQMSMVLRDAAYDRMTHTQWQEAVAPKVQGTWNLHTAFSNQSLDFFVLFSSISGIVGNPGQANYASANTFLDAFVQFRHGQGLPASVLDLGVMGDIGYISQNPAVMDHFKPRAGYVLREKDLLESVELAIKRSFPRKAARAGNHWYMNESQLGIGFRMTLPTSSPDNHSVWKRDPRMSVYRNLEAVDDNYDRDMGGGGNDTLKEFLAAAATDPSILAHESSVLAISNHIGFIICDYLMKPVEEMDTGASPSALGIDSLVATELRKWCRQKFGVGVSVLEIMGAASIEQLGRSVAVGLAAKYK